MEGRRGGGRRRKGRKGKGKDPVDLIPQEKFPTYVTAKKIYALIHKKASASGGLPLNSTGGFPSPRPPYFMPPT